MNKKIIVKEMLHTFFVVYFLISLLIAVLNITNIQSTTVDNSTLFRIMGYALMGSLPSFLTYYRKEPTLRQILIRRMLQLILIIVLVIAFGVFLGEMQWANALKYGFLISLVYGMEFVFSTIFNMLEAQKITYEIKEFREKHQN